MAIIEKIQVSGSTYDIGVLATHINGTIPADKLPSYVDDVIEGYYSGGKFYSDSAKTKVITGETGKIYVDITNDDGLSYRCTTNDSSTQTYIAINGSNNISKNVVTSSPTANTNASAGNGSVYLNHLEESNVTSSHKISGSGATTVTADASGNIIISSTDHNTDTKVTNTLNTTNKGYITATTTPTTNTGTQIFDTGVYLGTSAGYLHATTFVGALSGNATTATTANKLSTTSHNLVGGGITAVTASGNNIVISTPDTNTDTKVTSAANHYDPTNETISNLGGAASTNTAATWGTTDFITGVTIKKDPKGHITGLTLTSAQMPSNPNTDRSVTSASYHYTPTFDTNSTITKNASASAAAGWNSTSLVTGISVYRDSKGHVTDVTLTSVKMPSNPNTDTHYTSKNVVTNASNATANASAGNGSVYLNHLEESNVTSSHKISGSGITTVTASGNNIVISTPDTNTDTKVTNNLNTTNKGYITATTTSTTNTGTQIFDTGVYLGTSAGYLHATTFVGALSGNATTATTANKLSTTSHNLVGGGITAVSSLNGNIVINTPVSYNSGTKTLILG